MIIPSVSHVSHEFPMSFCRGFPSQNQPAVSRTFISSSSAMAACFCRAYGSSDMLSRAGGNNVPMFHITLNQIGDIFSRYLCDVKQNPAKIREIYQALLRLNGQMGRRIHQQNTGNKGKLDHSTEEWKISISINGEKLEQSPITKDENVMNKYEIM